MRDKLICIACTLIVLAALAMGCAIAEANPAAAPGEVMYFNLYDFRILQDLLDAERNAYVIDQPMPDIQSGSYYVCATLINEGSGDPDQFGVYLVSGEEYLEALVVDMRSWGLDVTWDYDDAVPESQAQAYVLHIVDQDGEPVPGVAVNFCTDTACTMLQSDGSGTICFDGAPDACHVQLLKAPEGYSFDPDFELYTGKAYGEWRVRICREATGEPDGTDQAQQEEAPGK